jgi:mycoredoxin
MNIPTGEIVVYSRPGCGFSASLLRGLRRWGLSFEVVDIWQDEDAAAVVRSIADGNETVPTVVVDGLGLVNPSPRDVLRVVGERLPERLPAAAREDLARPPGRFGPALGRILGEG